MDSLCFGNDCQAVVLRDKLMEANHPDSQTFQKKC